VWSEPTKLDRLLAPSDFSAQIEFSGLWVLYFGYWLVIVEKNVTSFEWPVTDTVVQYSVITTIYIYSSMKSHLVILLPCP
jgi:hypothetical protein